MKSWTLVIQFHASSSFGNSLGANWKHKDSRFPFVNFIGNMLICKSNIVHVFQLVIPAHAITCIMTFTQITLYFSKSVHNSFEQINVNELIFAVMNCFNITRAGFAISKINATVIYRCSTNILTVNQLTLIRYC